MMIPVNPILMLTKGAMKTLVARIGNHVDEEKIAGVVLANATAACLSATAANYLPGVGATIANGAFSAIIYSMYVELAFMLGVHFKKDILIALATVCLSEQVMGMVVNIASNALATLFPIIGATMTNWLVGAANFAVVCSAGIIFIEVVAALVDTDRDINYVAAEEVIAIAKERLKEIDFKALVALGLRVVCEQTKEKTAQLTQSAKDAIENFDAEQARESAARFGQQAMDGFMQSVSDCSRRAQELSDRYFTEERREAVAQFGQRAAANAQIYAATFARGAKNTADEVRDSLAEFGESAAEFGRNTAAAVAQGASDLRQRAVDAVERIDTDEIRESAARLGQSALDFFKKFRH